MLSEFQTTADRLLQKIRAVLHDALGQAVIDPLTVSGQEVWVTGVRLVDEPSIESGPGDAVDISFRSPYWGEDFLVQQVVSQRLVINNDIQLDLATRSEAVFTPQGSRTVRLPIIVTSRVAPGSAADPRSTPDAGVRLSFTLGTPTLVGDTDPALDSILKARVGALIPQPPDVTIPFDAFMLSNTDTRYPMNAGIALSSDKTFVCVRLETPVLATTADPWVAFFAGTTDNRLLLAGALGFLPSSTPLPWCLFVGNEAFKEAISNGVYSALRDAAVFDFVPGVLVDWSTRNGSVRISISFAGHKTLTTILGEDVVGELSVGLTLDLSVPRTDVLQIDVGYVVDAVSIGGIDASFVVRVIVEEIVSSQIGTTFSASKILGDKSAALGPLIKDIRCTVTGPSTMRCDGSVRPPSAGGLAGHVRDALGISSGIVLMGEGVASPLPSEPEVQLDVRAFSWSAGPPTCNALQDAVQQAGKRPLFETLVAAGNVRVSNGAPGSSTLSINQVDVLDDFTSSYRDLVVGDDIHTFCGYPPPTFPCILAVHTNIGVTLATIAPPPTLTDAEARGLVGEALNRATAACEKLKDPWHLHSLKPDWLVDPAPDDANASYSQLWEFEVPASSLGGIVTASLGPNQAEVRHFSSAGRPLSASFLTRPKQAVELQLRESAKSERSPASYAPGAAGSNTDGSSGGKQLDLAQTLLHEAAQIRLDSSPRGIALLHAGSSPLLAVGSASGLSLFDLRAPSRPALAFSLPLAGLIGLAEAPRGQILAWGDFGLAVIKGHDRQFLVNRILTSPVRSVARLRDRWFASSSDGIAVLDRELQRERVLAAPRQGCGHLCSLSDRLLWTSDGGALQSSSSGSQWSAIDTDTGFLPKNFDAIRVGLRSYLFAPHEGRGGATWTLANGRLAIVAEYEEDPWFRWFGRLPKLLATANRAGTVSVYEVAAHRWRS